MASPEAHTPEINPKAYIGHSVLLTVKKQDKVSPDEKPKPRSQRRVPKKTYFEGDDDDDDDVENEEEPAAASQQSFVPPKRGHAKKQAQHSNPDPLNAMIESDFDVVDKTNARPKKHLKDQLQPDTKVKPTTGSKKQAAKQKSISNTKSKQPTTQRVKGEQRGGGSSEPVEDEYDMEVSSPTAHSKSTKAPARKTAHGPRATQTKRKSSKKTAVATKSTSQQSPILVEDVGDSPIYEDPEESVEKPSSASSDNRRALQPLNPNQSQKAGGGTQSLVDDQRDRKPHLISFGTTGPRNQGMSEDRLAQATKRRPKDSVIEDSMPVANDDTAKTGAQTQETAFNATVQSHSQNPGIFRQDDEIGFHAGSSPLPNVTAHGQGKENQLFAKTSSQEGGKQTVNLVSNQGASAVMPHLNGPALPKVGDGYDALGQPLPDSRDRSYYDNQAKVYQPSGPYSHKQAPALEHQKRGSDEMLFATESGDVRYKRAKVGDHGESSIAMANAVVGTASTAAHGFHRGDHIEQDPFKSRKSGETRVNTSFNRRLVGFWSEDGQSKGLGAQADEGQVSHSPDEQPGRNEVAQRMYQSLSNNMTAQSCQSRSSGTDNPPRQADTNGSGVGAASPSQSPEDRPGNETAGPYPRLAGTMQEMNHMVLAYLQSKESDLHDIVIDYEVNAGEIVRRLAVTHLRESQVAMRQVDTRQRGLINMWTDTRRNIHSMIEAVKAVNVGRIVASIHQDKSLDHLRSLQSV